MTWERALAISVGGLVVGGLLRVMYVNGNGGDGWATASGVVLFAGFAGLAVTGLVALTERSRRSRGN